MNLPVDWKRAVDRAPLHWLMSIPVAIAAFIIPPIGYAYINWRAEAEGGDVAAARDSIEKSVIDVYTQTVIVTWPLKFWKAIFG